MGVTKIMKNGRLVYRARVSFEGKRVHAGYRKTHAEAMEASNQKLNELYAARDQKIADAVIAHGITSELAEDKFGEEVRQRLAIKETPTMFTASKPSLFKRVKQFFHQ